MSRVIERLKQAGRRITKWLVTPLGQGLLALANGVASFACFRASKKPLYRISGALLAIFSTYHAVKVIQAIKPTKLIQAVKRRWAR